MYPEEWNRIQHLLLLYCLDEIETLPSLQAIADFLCASLPTATIQLLLISNNCYRFYSAHHPIKLTSFISSLANFQNQLNLIDYIKHLSFDSAIIFTTPTQSPFSLAYLCYLANIPIRLGQSHEFGGGVLSHCIQPSLDTDSMVDYNLHLLKAAGLPGFEPTELVPDSSSSLC